MIHRERVPIIFPKASTFLHLLLIAVDVLFAYEEMPFATLPLTCEVTLLFEGDAVGVLHPLAPVHEVGVQAEDAQLGLGGVPEPVGDIHGDKDWTSSSNVMSVAFIKSLCLSFLVKNEADPAFFPSLWRFENLICVWSNQTGDI